MLRMLLVTLLGLSLAVVAWADDPKPKADPKPQWQRLMTGDDARKADDLEKRTGELENADKHAEAVVAAEGLLALRTRVQGADHWETVNQKWRLVALRKVAALPQEKRQGWRKAAQGDAEAQDLEQKIQHAKALPLRQQRLKWCREVLGEDHPHTAASYHNVGFNLAAQGKYTEAAPLCEKALAIRLKALGEEHPDTAQSYTRLAGNLKEQAKYGQAAPLYQKALDITRQTLGEDHEHTAGCYNDVAITLSLQGNYGQAAPLLQKSLDIHRKVHDEDHPDTATAYNNLAFNLHAQGKYGQAAPLFQMALDIYRKASGEDHPSTAAAYNNCAVNLEVQGKYAEARIRYQKALDIWRRAFGEEHPQTALGYYSVASNLTTQGRNTEARALYQKALDIWRRSLGEDHITTAEGYSGVAGSLKDQGKYAEAAPLFQKALDISRKSLGEDHTTTAEGYNRVAGNLKDQGKYEAAGPLFQKALDIRRKALGENHPSTAVCYNNVALNLNYQRRYAEAELLFQKALDIRRQTLGEDNPDTAYSYYRVAHNQYVQGNYADALASLVKGTRSYEAARLAVATGGLDRAAYGASSSPHAFLAAAQIRAGQAAEAWTALETDLGRGLLDEMALRRGLRLTADESVRRDEMSTSRSALEARVLALVTAPRRTAAEAAELERLIENRQQLEQSLGELAVAVNRREVASLKALHSALPADAAFLAWVDVFDQPGQLQEHWGCIVLSEGEPRWERLTGSGPGGEWSSEDTNLPLQFRAALARSAPAAEIEALARKLHEQRLAPLAKHLAGVKRLFVAPVNQMAGIPVEALTDQYTISYTPSGTYLARLKDRERPRGAGLLAVGDPLFPPVKEAKQPTALPPGGLLITQVVPDSAAAKARLQGGDVLVAYAGEDLTSVEQLGKLIAAKAGEKSVLAKVWREGQEKPAERELPPGRLGVLLDRDPARDAIVARRRTDQMLAKLTRGDDYAELPGTQVEIARLAALFDARLVTKLTRQDASEERLDELRKADKLKQFRYLHLATHGQANNVRDFESALILTKPTKPPEERPGEPYLDGRLTAAEVRDYWKLDAELVTLSACESGLGRQGGGDGLLGFAQAFLLVGSRSVCLTLWQVDDTATALLMDRFYRNLLGKREDGGKPMPKAEALREAKQWLRALTATEALDRLGVITKGVVRGERPAREEMRAVPKPKDAAKDYKPYAHPRYWAAFILIGDPE